MIRSLLSPFLLLNPLMFEFCRGSANVCGAYSFTYIMPLRWKSSSIGQNDCADAAKISNPK